MGEFKQQQAVNLTLMFLHEGIVQKRLAEQLGVTHITVSNWKRGKVGISAEHAAKLHELYPGYSVEYIRGLSPYQNKQAEVWEMENTEYPKMMERIKLLISAAEKGGYTVQLLEDPDAGDYLRIVDNGRVAELDAEQMDALAKEIIGFACMRINSMLERGEW